MPHKYYQHKPKNNQKIPNKSINNQVKINNSMFNIPNFLQSQMPTSPLSTYAEGMYNNNYQYLTLNYPVLSNMYTTHGILQTLIDQPVNDAFKGGIKIKSDELDNDDLELLYNFISKNKIITEFKQALKWARLYGGAGIILNNGEDPSKELNYTDIKDNNKFKLVVCNRWELSMPINNFADPLNNAGFNNIYSYYNNKPEVYYNYYGIPIHESRVMILIGKEAPVYIRRLLQGWGLSELESINRDFNLYIKNQNITYDAMDKYKQDVLRIFGYGETLLQGGDAAMDQRLATLALTKNFQNMMVLDKEDEYEQIPVNFAGIADIQKENRIGIAASFRIPMAKLFGMSAAGFNSGEDDIENYNSRIESDIRNEAVESDLKKILEICCNICLGYIPEFKIEWRPLRELSTSEIETKKTEEYNRLISLYDRGLLNSEQLFENLKENNVMYITDYNKDPDLPEYVSQQAPYPKELDKEKAIKPQEKSQEKLGLLL